MRSSTPSTVLLLAAFILLLLVSLSVPVLRSISLFTLTFSSYTLTLGVFGLCSLDKATGITQCSAASVGYSLDALTATFGLSGLAATSTIPGTLINGLTYSLILHPIAAGVAAIALILALLGHLREFLLSSFSSSFTSAALSLSITALIIDLVLFLTARARLTAVGIPSTLGNGLWMVVAACILLLLSGMVGCCVGRRNVKREREREVSDAGKPAVDSGYGERMRRDALLLEQENGKARNGNMDAMEYGRNGMYTSSRSPHAPSAIAPAAAATSLAAATAFNTRANANSYGNGNGNPTVKKERGLPSFGDREGEIIPLSELLRPEDLQSLERPSSAGNDRYRSPYYDNERQREREEEEIEGEGEGTALVAGVGVGYGYGRQHPHQQQQYEQQQYQQHHQYQQPYPRHGGGANGMPISIASGLLAASSHSHSSPSQSNSSSASMHASPSSAAVGYNRGYPEQSQPQPQQQQQQRYMHPHDRSISTSSSSTVEPFRSMMATSRDPSQTDDSQGHDHYVARSVIPGLAAVRSGEQDRMKQEEDEEGGPAASRSLAGIGGGGGYSPAGYGSGYAYGSQQPYSQQQQPYSQSQYSQSPTYVQYPAGPPDTSAPVAAAYSMPLAPIQTASHPQQQQQQQQPSASHNISPTRSQPSPSSYPSQHYASASPSHLQQYQR